MGVVAFSVEVRCKTLHTFIMLFDFLVGIMLDRCDGGRGVSM